MPDAEDWEFSRGARRYRDLRTGRFLPNRTIIELRNGLAENRAEAISNLADTLVDGGMSVQRWELEMREAVKLAHVTEYTFGRGGRRAMSSEDWGRLGQQIREQYVYLHNFAQDVQAGRYTNADGDTSLAAVRARAALYGESAVYAHSRGQEAAAEGLALPCHPGDGGTPCLARCKCRWTIVETSDQWEATWRLGSAEHCDGCLSRAANFAPYVQLKLAA